MFSFHTETESTALETTKKIPWASARTHARNIFTILTNPEKTGPITGGYGNYGESESASSDSEDDGNSWLSDPIQKHLEFLQSSKDTNIRRVWMRVLYLIGVALVILMMVPDLLALVSIPVASLENSSLSNFTGNTTTNEDSSNTMHIDSPFSLFLKVAIRCLSVLFTLGCIFMFVTTFIRRRHVIPAGNSNPDMMMPDSDVERHPKDFLEYEESNPIFNTIHNMIENPVQTANEISFIAHLNRKNSDRDSYAPIKIKFIEGFDVMPGSQMDHFQENMLSTTSMSEVFERLWEAKWNEKDPRPIRFILSHHRLFKYNYAKQQIAFILLCKYINIQHNTEIYKDHNMFWMQEIHEIMNENTDSMV